jgi:O-antigen/teichoic acid export membrane protein
MRELSRFYSSLGLLTVLNAVIKPLWIFGIDRQVQNTVGPTEYGTYFSLFNLSIMLSFTLDWGLTAYFNRQLASQQEGFKRLTGEFFQAKIQFITVFSILVLIVAGIAGVSNQRFDIVLGVIAIQAFSSLFLFFRAVITADQRFRTDAWLSVLDKGLMILACSYFLFIPSSGGITINKFIWLQVACTAISIFVSIPILLRAKFLFHFYETAFPLIPSAIWKKLKAAFPYALIVLLMSVHYRFDGFLLERIYPSGAHEAGIYATGYRLLDAGNMIPTLFTIFLLPFIARRWSQRKEITSVILNLRHFLLVLAIGIALVAIFMAPWLQQVLYPSGNGNITAVLQWCLPALIGYTLVNIYGTVLTATGHIRTFCIITTLAVCINIVLNLILIPRHGAIGCCIAALISQTICGITCMWVVKKQLSVHAHVHSLIIYIIIAGLIGVVFYSGNYLGILPWLTIIIAALIALGIMAASGLLKLNTWRSGSKMHVVD